MILSWRFFLIEQSKRADIGVRVDDGSAAAYPRAVVSLATTCRALKGVTCIQASQICFLAPIGVYSLHHDAIPFVLSRGLDGQ